MALTIDKVVKCGVVVHQRRRLNMSKTIFDFKGERYVLIKFRSHRQFTLFLEVIQTVISIGTSVQSVTAKTESWGEVRRHGYCVLLNYIPGTAIKKRPQRVTLLGLGRNLGLLHSIVGFERRKLFLMGRPHLPHRRYLPLFFNTGDHHRWIRESRDRLTKIRANQLTHGDLYSDNIIIDSHGGVSLIDYESMVFELAGIEFAILLLRPFARRKANRRLLLKGYLETCGKANADRWERYGDDFLFAAAARLELSRAHRIRRLQWLKALMYCKKWLGLLPHEEFREHISNNNGLIDMSRRHLAYFKYVRRWFVKLRLVYPDAHPLALLEQINTSFSDARRKGL